MHPSTGRRPRRPWPVATIALALWACAAGPADGEPGGAFARFYHQAWGVREGAPGTVTALAQDRDGYLLVGSPDGLWRFDGVRFQRVPLPLRNVLVSRLWTVGDVAWAAVNRAGLVRLDGDRVRQYGAAEGLPNGVVSDMAVDADGVTWAVMAAGVFALRDDRWRRQPIEPGPLSSLAVDGRGDLWVLAAGRLSRRIRATKAFETIDTKAPPRAIAAGPDGAIHAACTTPEPQVRCVPGAGVTKLRVDRGGGAWLIGSTAVRYVEPGTASGTAIAATHEFGTADGLSGENTFDVYEDREGNVWVGTSGGLDLFRRTALAPAGLPADMHGVRLSAGPDGRLWAGSQTHSLTVLAGGVATTLTGGGPASIVAAGPDGRVWAWSATGPQRVEAGGVRALRRAPFGEPAVFLVADAGGVWAAPSAGGLYRFDGQRWSVPRLEGVDAATLQPWTGIVDEHGRLWVGLRNGGIVVVDQGRAELHEPPTELVGQPVSGLARLAEATWVAARTGLAVLEAGRIRPMHGVDADTTGRLSGVVAARDGSLWLNAARGIVRIDADDVRRMRADANHRPTVKVFDYLDGVIGGAALVPPQSAVATSDGRLWFVGFNRVVTLDPARLVPNGLAPPVRVETLRAGEHLYHPPGPVELPVGTSQVQIRYTALSLTMPGRIRFRYQLSGVDATPQDGGTRREAYYTNLGPGTYRFTVTASNNDGLWNDTGASLSFVVPPAYYQTRPFRAGLAAAALLLAWAAYRRRVAAVTGRMRGEVEARLAERERIARDLHDTMLQGFQGLLLRFQAVAATLPHDAPAADMLTRALDQGERVLVEGRERVAALRTAGPVADLAAALAAAADEIRGAGSGPACRLVVEGESRPLHPLVRDEVYWIAREALVNAHRHAAASAIEIEVAYLPHELRVRCRDDGRGIAAAGPAGGTHFGVLGMRERARRIAAHLEMWSRPGAGTEVDLRVPAGTAYAWTGRTPWWRRALATLGGARWPRPFES